MNSDQIMHAGCMAPAMTVHCDVSRAAADSKDLGTENCVRAPERASAGATLNLVAENCTVFRRSFVRLLGITQDLSAPAPRFIARFAFYRHARMEVERGF